MKNKLMAMMFMLLWCGGSAFASQPAVSPTEAQKQQQTAEQARIEAQKQREQARIQAQQALAAKEAALATVHLLVVSEQFSLDRSNVTQAQVVSDRDPVSVVVLLNDAGAQQLYKLTKNNVDKLVLMIWNNKLLTIAKISSAIESKSFQISGFTRSEANIFVRSVSQKLGGTQ